MDRAIGKAPIISRIAESMPRILPGIDFLLRVSVITISAFVIYHEDVFIIGSDALYSDYYNYVLVIPFLAAYLIYRKRYMLAAIMSTQDEDERRRINFAAGLSMLLTSAVLYLYGLGPTIPLDIHLISLELFVAGSILILFNRKTLRILIPPILLFLAALPSITQYITFGLWRDVSLASSIPAQWMLVHLVNLDVSLAFPTANIPTLVLTTTSGATYSFAVAVASSGVYSMVGFTLFAAFLGYVSKGSPLKKVALFASAYPLLIAINILRETILVSVANIWGIIAFDVFHATSGIVLVFIVTLILLIVGDQIFGLNFFPAMKNQKSCFLCAEEFSEERKFCTNCGKFFFKKIRRRIDSSDILAIVSLVILAGILFAFFVPAYTTTNAPTKLPIQSISASNADSLLPQIPGWNLNFIYRDTYVQEALQQDAALVYTYTQNTNATNPTTFYVIIQVSSGLHTPEDSLIVSSSILGGSGTKVLTDSSIQILNQPYLVGTFFVYQQSNETAAYVYWITRAAFNFGSYYDFRNVEISIWQDTNALMASGVLSNPINLTAMKQLYLPLASSIAKFWQPQSANSIIRIVVQRWSLALITLALIPAAVAEVYGIIGKQRQNTAHSRILEKFSRDDSLLESVKASCKERKQIFSTKRVPSTLQQILLVHRSRTGESLDPKEAVKQLTYLEYLGLVRRDVTSDSTGYPTEVWQVAV